MNLRIGTSGGKSFTLPADLVTQTAAILAKKGSGKSYTAAVIVEELLDAGQQAVIIDPTGAHWGLRSSADGKAAGFPIVVVGGDHADLPLEEGAGEILARAIVEQRFSAIIDLSLLRKGAATRFLCAFFEALYRLNRAALHLVCDEADLYAPQKPFAEEARTLGAIEDIVRRGRIRGIGCTLITQRPAVLNKNVLTQAEMLIALRLVHPKDIAPVMEWVRVHADEAQAQRMVDSLPSLPIGEAWFWSPGWGDIFARVQVRRRRTFDSGATPKAGEVRQAPKVLAAIDVEKLGAEIKATVERAKADDPRELRRQLAEAQRLLGEAQRQLAKPRQLAVDVEALGSAEVGGQLRGREEVMKHVYTLRDGLKDVSARIAALLSRDAAWHLPPLGASPRRPGSNPPPPGPRPPPPPNPPRAHAALAPRNGSAGLSKAERLILTALAQYPAGRTKQQVAILAGYAVNGGGFNNAVSACRSAGYLDGAGDRLQITDAGAAALGPFEPLPHGDALLQHWLGQLGKAEREVLKAATMEYPRAASKEAIAAAAGYQPTGGGFNNALSRLRTLELIEGRGEIRASEALFG